MSNVSKFTKAQIRFLIALGSVIGLQILSIILALIGCGFSYFCELPAAQIAVQSEQNPSGIA